MIKRSGRWTVLSVIDASGSLGAILEWVCVWYPFKTFFLAENIPLHTQIPGRSVSLHSLIEALHVLL
jgi:hypothetical protein